MTDRETKQMIKDVEKLLRKNRGSWFAHAVGLIALLSIKSNKKQKHCKNF